MRLFWSVVLTGGLFLTGFSVFESRREVRQSGIAARGGPPVLLLEDGTPLPPPPPP